MERKVKENKFKKNGTSHLNIGKNGYRLFKFEMVIFDNN